MNGSEIAALMPNLSAKELEAELARAPLAKAAMEAAIAAKATAETAQAQAEAAQAQAETAKAAAETALAALQTAAGALTTALVAEGATIAGCAEEIAAVNALLPSAAE